MKGLVTVAFSETLMTPENYTIFNDNFLKLSIIPGEELQKGENKSIEAWQIVDFRAMEMDIQVNFTNPLQIS